MAGNVEARTEARRTRSAVRERYDDPPRTSDLDAMLTWLQQNFGAKFVDSPLRPEDRLPPLAEVVGQIDLKAVA